MNRQYWVYLMTNYSKTMLYCGVTNDLERRVYEHKTKSVPGFTSKYVVNRLVWFEDHKDIDLAIRREKLIKKWRRTWKEHLINEKNPDWKDLSADWDKYGDA